MKKRYNKHKQKTERKYLTPYTSSRKALFLLSSLDKINLLRNFTLVKLKTIKFEPVHEISNNVVFVTSKASDQPAHMRCLIGAIAGCFEYSIIVKLLIEHHLQFQSLKGGCGGSSGSAVVKNVKLFEITCCGSILILLIPH